MHKLARACKGAHRPRITWRRRWAARRPQPPSAPPHPAPPSSAQACSVRHHECGPTLTLIAESSGSRGRDSPMRLAGSLDNQAPTTAASPKARFMSYAIGCARQLHNHPNTDMTEGRCWCLPCSCSGTCMCAPAQSEAAGAGCRTSPGSAAPPACPASSRTSRSCAVECVLVKRHAPLQP